MDIDPQPTDEEAAAIAAAYQALWPRPVAVLETADSPSRWRFADRRWIPRPAYGGWR